MADLYWHGDNVRSDHARALALMKIADGNAAISDRLWIEDGYQTFYCGANPVERTRAGDLAAVFRQSYGHSLSSGHGPQIVPNQLPASALGRHVSAARRCANGEPVDSELHGALVGGPSGPPLANSFMPAGPRQTLPAGMTPDR
jgi:hypothetical protein